MRQRRLYGSILLCAVTAFCACNGQSSGAVRRNQETRPKSEPRRERLGVAERVRCESDAECINSCSQGAVSKAWYERAYPGGEACEDGCANQRSGPPRCLNGACAAFTITGEASPGCTNRTGNEIERVGPAHRCEKDDDCEVTCTWGAVNRAWRSYAQRVDTCKDGCASFTAHCTNSICTTYDRDKPVRNCTQRSIW